MALQHDLVASLLLVNLKRMVEHEVDYMTINRLGDPEKQQRIRQARDAIAQAEALYPSTTENT